MILAVVALHAHIDDGESIGTAGDHGVFDPLLDGAHVVARDSAADDRIDELEPGTAVQWADTKVGDRVLSVPAGLLLDLAFGVAGADHGLAVRHAHVFGLDPHAELPGQALERNRQVIFRYCDAEGRITRDANPNGSARNIAGVCNALRNVLGMMPHPERCAEALLGNTDGLGVFRSIAASMAKV